MPLTEIVLIVTGFAAYAIALGLWIGRCAARVERTRRWPEPAPAWQRLATEPRVVFVASLPIPAWLVFLVLHASIVAGTR